MLAYRFSSFLALLTTLGSSAALNILLNNDDSWASANIRELYRELKRAGHRVLLVAPAVNNSGRGGATMFANSANLTSPAEFNSAPAGAPAWGSSPLDSTIWYYNGTPAAVTHFAIDYLIPRLWNSSTTLDLYVSGPNEGWSLGPYWYTLSGTIGSAYAAIERGTPAIAFSAGNSTHRSYQSVDGPNDVAVLNAKAAVKVVNALAIAKSYNARLLPYGYGVSVNIPYLNSSCSDPSYAITRLTGGARSYKAEFDASANVFTMGTDSGPGLNTCINGDCSLPGEAILVQSCSVAISLFTVDYDAPDCQGLGASAVQSLLQPLLAKGNHTIGTPSTPRTLPPTFTATTRPSQVGNQATRSHPARAMIVGELLSAVLASFVL